MKREIKFRIWDGSKMEYSVLAGAMGVVYVNPANGGVNPRDTACITPFNTIYPDGIEVMQYTGILDKNGKEIYEGDIVGINEPTISCDNMQVIFRNGSFLCGRQGYIPYDLWRQRKGCTVIGNIHDNPELVK